MSTGGVLSPTALQQGPRVVTAGYYRLALRRLLRYRTALAFGAIFLLVLIACLCAPLYSRYVAHIGPDVNDVTGTVRVHGRARDVVSPQGIPIGPTWHARFLLGADLNGRDVAVRLLYGGRTSIEIGAIATVIMVVLGTAIGLAAGYYRGAADAVLSRLLDLIWAYPAVLLGIALGTALAVDGISIGPVKLTEGSAYLPAFVIGFVFMPYVAKPIRGQVMSLRQKEFIDAARVMGIGSFRIMYSEIFPNISSTAIVFVPLMMANAILLEAGLSFLGAGVQPPNASWGTMIASGIDYITVAPTLVLAPSVMLVLAVLGMNVFGEAVRDALDPRASVHMAH